MRTKELTRIALGSVAGALLGAVAFLGIEGVAPRAADAHQDPNGEPYYGLTFEQKMEVEDMIDKGVKRAVKCFEIEAAQGPDPSDKYVTGFLKMTSGC